AAEGRRGVESPGQRRGTTLATPKPRPETPVSEPSRYIAKVSVRTGEEVPGPIDPEDLLVHAHRDKHPVEVAAQFLASRVVQLTGKEDRVRRALRRINTLGVQLAETLGSAIGSDAVERQAKRLIGVIDRDVVFRFRETTRLSERDVQQR